MTSRTRDEGRARYLAVVVDTAFEDVRIEQEVLRDIDCDVVVANQSAAGVIAEFDPDVIFITRATIDESVLEGATRLRAIARYGVGVETIDVAAAARRNVKVVNVPDYCTHEVAEHVLAQILGLARQVVRLDRAVRRGEWSQDLMLPTSRVEGRVAGVVGLGRIGREVARRCAGIGLRVVGFDPYVRDAGERVDLVGFDELLAVADFVTLHLPLTPETRGLISKRELGLMKRTSYLINCARGGLIDEEAVADALESGRIAGVALDVLSCEPPPLDLRLLSYDNVILTPHVAFYSEEAVAIRKRRAAEAVRSVLRGEPTPALV